MTIMKNIFLFLMVTVAALSCKKAPIEQDIIITSNKSPITNSNVMKGEVAGKIKIRVILSAEWVNVYQSCISGWWYCWEITNEPDAREYININDKDKLITFGIDNILNEVYNKSFIDGSNFNFPKDAYIKSSIVKAAIGLDKVIFVKKGLYNFKNIDGILTVTAPYTIVE